MESSGSTEQQVGRHLRKLRAGRNLSVRTLASRAGCSPSFISQIETAQASPSIASLQRIATALGVTLAEFFSDFASASTEIDIVRADQRPQLTSQWSDAQIEALSRPSHEQYLESMMITIMPGGRSGTRLISHPEDQFVFILEGEIELISGTDSIQLQHGDAATVSAGSLGRWRNPRPQPAKMLVVSSVSRRRD